MEVQNGTNGHVGPEKMGEEKVEMKEVTEELPLKEAEANGQPVEKKREFKNPFAFLTRKAADKTPAEAEEKADVEAEVKEPKPPRTWFWQKAKKEGAEPVAEKKEDGLIFGLNLDDRDEKGINDHVKLSFEDILAEPEGYHSFDCAWRLTFRLFTVLRSFLYKLLAVVVAVPCAILWALVFALLTVINVWACVPAARALAVPATWLAKVWNFVVRSVLDPCFRSCGLVCASVRVTRVQEPPALPANSPPPIADPAQLA